MCMQQMQFRPLNPPSYPLSCEFRTEGSYCWVSINYGWANHSYNATPCSYQENPIILLERFTSPGLLERYNYAEFIVYFIARLNPSHRRGDNDDTSGTQRSVPR